MIFRSSFILVVAYSLSFSELLMSLDTQQILCQCCIWSVEYQDQLLPSCEDSFAVRQYKDKRNTVSDTPLTFHRNTALLDRGCLVTPSSKRSDKLVIMLHFFASSFDLKCHNNNNLKKTRILSLLRSSSCAKISFMQPVLLI